MEELTINLRQVNCEKGEKLVDQTVQALKSC